MKTRMVTSLLLLAAANLANAQTWIQVGVTCKHDTTLQHFVLGLESMPISIKVSANSSQNGWEVWMYPYSNFGNELHTNFIIQSGTDWEGVAEVPGFLLSDNNHNYYWVTHPTWTNTVQWPTKSTILELTAWNFDWIPPAQVPPAREMMAQVPKPLGVY